MISYNRNRMVSEYQQKVREEESIKALKLEDEKGYINKNVDDDSNDQGQVKKKQGSETSSLYL